jgi:hypothetical protein
VRVCLPIVVSLLCLSIQASAQSLSGDFNRNCRVDFNDLARLSHRWLTNDSNADINRDSRVNFKDFAVLAGSWRQRECPIVINELLAHSHDKAPDWIELFNISSLRVDIGGWSLSDSRSNLGKYMIPMHTIVEPNDYIVFYEDLHFGNVSAPGVQHPFRLSENGDSVYLYSGNDPNYPQFLMSETFGASETWITFGRYLKSTGQYAFPLLSRATPGGANAYPQVGPVVVNEVMYHPSADGDAEYIELLNVTTGPVTLYDYSSLLPWRLTTDSGIDVSLPIDPPITLEPNACLLIAKDLTKLRKYYAVPAAAQVLQWIGSRIPNSGDTVRIWKPGDVDEAGTRYWIEVDRLAFSDGSHPENFSNNVDPWPTGADGDGQSLSRRFPSQYGDDPNNWRAAVPTPGALND